MQIRISETDPNVAKELFNRDCSKFIGITLRKFVTRLCLILAGEGEAPAEPLFESVADL